MPYALFAAFGCDGVAAYGAEPFLAWGGFDFFIIKKSETHGGFPFPMWLASSLSAEV